MNKVYALAGLAAVLSGCAAPASAWKGKVEWPSDYYSSKNIVPFTEAGAVLAAAAAIREMVSQNLAVDPGLFWGCSSPEQGLDVAVYSGPTPGLYYVLVDQRFDRCGGPRGRVLDGWYEYAVTPQGEVVAEAPPLSVDDFEKAPLIPELTPPTSMPPPDAAADAPAPISPPAEASPSEPEALPPPPAAPPPTGSQPPPVQEAPAATEPSPPQG